MSNFSKLLTIGLFALVSASIVPALADDHHDKKSYKSHSGMSAPPNQLYLDSCGGCHMAYPPALLPSGSWAKLIRGQADHFGQDLDLRVEDIDTLSVYLGTNSANSSGAKIARKIIRSLDGENPLRITDVPYIIHKHEDDDIPSGAFARKSVGSMANCSACHPGAARGYFDDDNVRIPPQ